MKNYINKFVCFFAVMLVVFFSGYYVIKANNHIDINKANNPNQKAIVKEQPNDQANIDEITKELPMRSQPVTELPWDNDEDFLKAKEENNAHILMGGFKTVLLNPGPGEEHNVHLCSKLLSGTVVKSGGTFSQNKIIGPYTASKGFKEGPSYTGGKLTKTTGGGVCKVASTIYNIAVLSNLPITQRHYHSMPVSYVPYGQDATVCYGARDITFKNTKSSPILIWSKAIGDTLYVGFYGSEPSPKVEWHHEVLSVKKAPTIYNKNSKLPADTRNVLLKGMDGKMVKSWVKIYHPDGKVETKQMGTSCYSPLPNIIEVDSEFKTK